MSSLKLMTEMVSSSNIETLTEDINGEKNYYISGIFMEADVMNGNKRIYPKQIIHPQVEAFQSIVNNGMAYGELDHPQSAVVSMQNASHRITKLWMEEGSSVVMGKAVLLDNAHGRTAISALKSGGRLAVSSRGVGTLGEGNIVQPNFKLITVDIVSNPSAPNAFVNGILENVEFILEGDVLIEKKIDRLKKALDNKGRRPAFDILNEWIRGL